MNSQTEQKTLAESLSILKERQVIEINSAKFVVILRGGAQPAMVDWSAPDWSEQLERQTAEPHEPVKRWLMEIQPRPGKARAFIGPLPEPEDVERMRKHAYAIV